MTLKGSVLRLNSWDKAETNFDDRVSNTAKKAKWGSGIVQYCEDEVTETETGTDRFQILHTADTVLVNVYFPVDKGKEGAEDYEVCLEALEQILNEELDEKNLIIAGDVNYQPNHGPRRRQALEKLCRAFKLQRHVPRETTYFRNNGSRSTLDQCLVSEGISQVKSKVLTGEHLPGNLSTHAAVLWTMSVKEEMLPEKKKVEKEDEPENKLFEASDVARIRAARTEVEEDDKRIVSLEKKIANKWRELKRRRSGYFSAGDARFQSVKKLFEIYPKQRRKVKEIEDLEKERAGKHG